MNRFRPAAFALLACALTGPLLACVPEANESSATATRETRRAPVAQQAAAAWRRGAPPPRSRAGLVPDGWEALEAHLKAGLRQHTSVGFAIPIFAPGPVPIGNPLLMQNVLTAGPLPDAASGRGFSTTRLQEAGVDEADAIKFDGRTLFVADNGGDYGLVLFRSDGSPLPIPERPALSIRVLEPDEANASVRELTRISLAAPRSRIDGLYLTEARDGAAELLAVLGTETQTSLSPRVPMPGVPGGLFTSVLYHPFAQVQRATLDLFDVSDPAAPRARDSLVFDGTLLASRRIGDTLYLVTRSISKLAAHGAGTESGNDAAALRRIETATPEQLLPQVRINDVVGPLVAAKSCFLPEVGAGTPSPQVITLSAIPLSSPQDLVSVCLSANVQTLYGAPRAMYLVGSDGNDTALHKFALTSRGPAFRGSAVVPGYLAQGGATGSQALGEHAGVLAVATSLFEQEPDGVWQRAHRLTFLRETRAASAADRALESIATLPNARRPEPIGKPGEDIRALRFIGDRIYAVTFRFVDPLYVIDRSNPEDPFIAGELSVPGFSQTLHPVGEELLVGVGSVSNGLGTQGVKVELFDVSDPDRIESLDHFAFGDHNASSAALSDPHALSFVAASPEYPHRFTVPIQRLEDATPSGEEPLPGFVPAFVYVNALHLFEVEPQGASGSGALHFGGAVEARPDPDAAGSNRYGWRTERGVIQGSAVHFLRDAEVWSAPWDDPENVVGPQ